MDIVLQCLTPRGCRKDSKDESMIVVNASFSSFVPLVNFAARVSPPSVGLLHLKRLHFK